MLIIGEITTLLTIIPIIFGLINYKQIRTILPKLILGSLMLELFFEVNALFLVLKGKHNLQIYSLISLQFVLLAGIINYLNKVRVLKIIAILIFIAGIVDLSLNFYSLPSYRPVIALSLLGVSALVQLEKLTRDSVNFFKDFAFWIFSAYVFYCFSSLTNYLFSKYFTGELQSIISSYAAIFNFISSLIFALLTSKAFLCLKKN